MIILRPTFTLKTTHGLKHLFSISLFLSTVLIFLLSLSPFLFSLFFLSFLLQAGFFQLLLFSLFIYLFFFFTTVFFFFFFLLFLHAMMAEMAKGFDFSCDLRFNRVKVCFLGLELWILWGNFFLVFLFIFIFIIYM